MNPDNLIEIRDLSVEFVTGEHHHRVVNHVSFDIKRGETWRWWAKAVRVNRSPPIRSCACCPTRWPGIRLAPSNIQDKTC